MSMKSLSLVAAAALSLCAGAAQAANGFANGGFETAGVSTPAASWRGAASGYTLSNDAYEGSNAALLQSPAVNAAVLIQNSIDDGNLPPLTLGDTPLLTFWAKGEVTETSNAQFALRYLDDIGNIKWQGSMTFHPSLKKDQWTQISYQGAAVPIGATAAFIEFVNAAGPLIPGIDDNRRNYVLIDSVNLSVAAIPEPSTYALMLAGLAGVGVLAKRRRQA